MQNGAICVGADSNIFIFIRFGKFPFIFDNVFKYFLASFAQFAGGLLPCFYPGWLPLLQLG